MRKTISYFYLLLNFLIITGPALAQEDDESSSVEQESKPLDPDYVGIHGMVLINNSSSLYASHLPTYRKPHNAQILYKIDSKDPALIYLVRDADMVTIKPELFNLQRLMRGEELTLKADVYIGHFERGGMLTYEGMDINFSKLLYLRMLEDLQEPVRLQKYDSVDINNNARFLIHQIQGAPSYDNILLIYENIGCITNITTPTTVPKLGEIINRLTFCGSMNPVHYETEDFQEVYSTSSY